MRFPRRATVGILFLLFHPIYAGPVAAQEQVVHLDQMSRALEALAEEVSPAVVQIFISRYAPTLGADASGVELFARERGTGSGVVVDPDGFIITNSHVVVGAERIQVLLSASTDVLAEKSSIVKPKGRVVSAELVGLDSETDLAVLKVKESDLPFLELGDSDELKPGQLVFAFGSPLGLETSVTMGVVSGVARQLEPEHPMIYIQTDASINPGNSGGPLVDTEGRVVGINTLILSQSGGNEGVGFAAPSNIVSHVYRQIRSTGRVHRGTIGIAVQTITPRMVGALGLPRATGVIVSDVIPGESADVAGLNVGDVVLALDGKPMENGRQFTVNLYQRAPGETVTLTVLRDQVNRTLRVEVVERTGDPTRFAGMVTIDKNLVRRLGVLGLDIDRSLGRMLPPRRKEGGVLVAARAGGALPWQNSLAPGDIIYTVNRAPVPDLAALKKLVGEFGTGASVVLQIERGRRLQYLTVELD